MPLPSPIKIIEFVREVVGLACIGDPYLCPIHVIGRRIIHLRRHAAPPNTPIARVYISPTRISSVTPSLIAQALRQTATFLGLELDFNPKDASARCL